MSFSLWLNGAHHYSSVDDTVDDANQEGDRSSSCTKPLYKLSYVQRRCTYSCSVTNARTKACAARSSVKFRRTKLLAKRTLPYRAISPGRLSGRGKCLQALPRPLRAYPPLTGGTLALFRTEGSTAGGTGVNQQHGASLLPVLG